MSATRWADQRWESFCLVTPNWQCRLPDFPYDGDDPEGFMGREEIVRYVQRFAEHIQVPVREGVEVKRLRASGGGGFRLLTEEGDIEAEQVVVATGRITARSAIPSRPACRSGSCSSMPATTTVPRGCPPARCWWWAAASRAVRSPKISSWPGAGCI